MSNLKEMAYCVCISWKYSATHSHRKAILYLLHLLVFKKKNKVKPRMDTIIFKKVMTALT